MGNVSPDTREPKFGNFIFVCVQYRLRFNACASEYANECED